MADGLDRSTLEFISKGPMKIRGMSLSLPSQFRMPHPHDRQALGRWGNIPLAAKAGQGCLIPVTLKDLWSVARYVPAAPQIGCGHLVLLIDLWWLGAHPPTPQAGSKHFISLTHKDFLKLGVASFQLPKLVVDASSQRLKTFLKNQRVCPPTLQVSCKRLVPMTCKDLWRLRGTSSNFSSDSWIPCPQNPQGFMKTWHISPAPQAYWGHRVPATHKDLWRLKSTFP